MESVERIVPYRSNAITILDFADGILFERFDWISRIARGRWFTTRSTLVALHIVHEHISAEQVKSM